MVLAKLLFCFSNILMASEPSGSVTLEEFVSLNASSQRPVPNQLGKLAIEYDQTFEISGDWSLRFHPLGRGVSEQKVWEENPVWDFRDLFLEWHRETFSFRAGFATPLWEGTDGLNPMDVAAVKDHSDPFRVENLGSPGLFVSRSTETFDFEGFWIPKQTRSRLPGVRNAVWPRTLRVPTRSESQEIRLPDSVEYEYIAREELDQALSHNGGLRTQFRTPWFDLSVAGFEGAGEIPLLQPIVNGSLLDPGPPKEIVQLSSPIQIQPIDYRRRTSSGLITMTFGSFIFRAAGRSDQPLGTDPRLPGASSQSVAGIEKSFEIGNQMLTVVLQGAWGYRSTDSGVVSMSDLFERASLGGLRWAFSESGTAMISGFQSREGSSLAQVQWEQRWMDSWKTSAEILWLGGSQDSLLGLLDDRDRASLRITRSF